MMALPWLFEHWAHPHQLPPAGDWKTWVVMGGRGAGKTRAGAEWVRRQVEGTRPGDPGRASRVALVAETLDQARDVMVMGESGILACSPPDRRPEWLATKRRLVWSNGAEAQIFSASDPESLRGPQFDAAWVDEIAKWKRHEEAWSNLQFALRLGEDPRQVVTTTPRDVAFLKALLEEPLTVCTSAPTEANSAFLAESFLTYVHGKYGGTAKGRQELSGEMVETIEGALWSRNMLEACRSEDLPDLDRVVVAVDPPVTGGEHADECGIVVAGAVLQGPPEAWRAYVLEDASCKAPPLGWAQAAVAAMKRHNADRLIAETNQGGDLVETLVRQVDRTVPYKRVGILVNHMYLP